MPICLSWLTSDVTELVRDGEAGELGAGAEVTGATGATGESGSGRRAVPRPTAAMRTAVVGAQRLDAPVEGVPPVGVEPG